jgi:hypothetical protein
MTGTVTRDGQMIDLSAKERSVFEALLSASPGGLSTAPACALPRMRSRRTAGPGSHSGLLL